jgi:pimeloyl-ACP methyl ester carboxylesterase
VSALAVRRAGAGPAVLWIHGYTMDATTWAPLWELLPGWRHVGVDLPGHGRSGPIEPGWSMAGFADRVGEVAAAEGAEAVVALSFGSIVALQLAIQRPELVRTMVLGAATIAGAPEVPEAGRRYREMLALRRIGAPAEAIAALWMTSPPDIFRGTEKHPRLRSALREVIVRHSWAELDTGAMAPIRSAVHTDADLARITARTLVVTGTEDMPVYLDNAARLGRTVPDVTLRTVPAAGHLVLLERPAEVAPLIAAHLGGGLSRAGTSAGPPGVGSA